VGGFFTRLAGLLGLALGGGQAAATAELEQLRQDSFVAEGMVTPLTAADAAAGVVKGHLTPGDGAGEAALNGVSSARFEKMTEITGNPPGPETLLEMLRRGFIDEGRVVEGIKQGLIKNEWAASLLALRDALIPPATLVEAAVEGHISQAVMAESLAEWGLGAVASRVMFETAGQPPGVMEMLGLLNRKVIGEATVDAAIRESHYKDKYLDAVKQLRFYIPPVRSINTLLVHGAITAARAAELYADRGMRPDDIAAYIASASHAKTASHKMLAVSTVQELFEARAIPHDEAVTFLEALGYDDAEAAFVLEVADLRRVKRLHDQAIGIIRTRYVGRKIGNAQAAASLDTLAVPTDERSQLLAIWALERDASPRLLTEAQLATAFRHGLIARADFVRRVRAIGYDEEDANLLAELTVPGAAPVVP